MKAVNNKVAHGYLGKISYPFGVFLLLAGLFTGCNGFLLGYDREPGGGILKASGQTADSYINHSVGRL